MIIPVFNEIASFSIRDKSGKEVPFEVLDDEAYDFWKKVYDSERISTGAFPFKNVWTPKCSWSDVLHHTFKNEIGRNFTWENVRLEVTRYLTKNAGNQLLDYHGTTPERKYYMLRDYHEIIGAFHKLFEYWKKEKEYELVSVSTEQ